MAILSPTLFLLVTVLVCVQGQYPDADGLPQRSGPTARLRYQRPQNARAGIQVQSVLGSGRVRRPIPLSRPRLAPIADISDYPTFGGPRPKPIFSSPLAGKEPQNPPSQQTRHEQQQQQQQSQEPAVKPVSEETEEVDDVAQAIANLGAVSNFGHQSGNLVSGPLTPKPDLAHIQNRGGPPSVPLNARPAPLIEQNIAPVQYRPQKPVKIRKPIIEDIPEYRPPTRQQQSQQVNQSPAKSVQRVSESRDKYTSREKKPVAQIIRRWREDNPDGSITWGFENDDGSYKEELIGVDCITRGKYGYVDLDGIRREYSYETGIKCDEEEQEEEKENGFVDYQENKLVLPNGKTIDLSTMGKKQVRRPQPAAYRN